MRPRGPARHLRGARLFACAWLALACACARAEGPASEIRLVRAEGYGATSSELIIRPDSVVVVKYFDPMQRGGDTIGIFRARGDAGVYAKLWKTLEKAEGAKGLRPDTRVLSVQAAGAGKTRTILIPMEPPVADWAKNFENVTDSLEGEATAFPVAALSLSVKPLSAKAKQDVIIVAANPGRRAARLGKESLLSLQVLAKPGPEGWPAGGPVWETLSETKLASDRDVAAGKKIEVAVPAVFAKPGAWYYRASFKSKGSMAPDSTRIRGETASAPDSVVIK